MVLFWLMSPIKAKNQSVNLGLGIPKVNLKGITICVMFLLGFLFFSAFQSLYLRPSFTPVVFGVMLICLMIVMLASNQAEQFLTKPAYMLPLICMIGIFVLFSIYLAQPAMGNGPLYAGVDAYRDYVNAASIMREAFIRPESMILEPYYRTFPALPIAIVGFALVSALPMTIAHLAILMVFYVMEVAALWLLATSIVRKSQLRYMIVVPVSLLFVLLQPYMIDPFFAVTPIFLTVPFITMIIYFAYWKKFRRRGGLWAVPVTIILLLIPVIPMHPISAILVISFLIVFPSAHVSRLTLGLLALVYFGLYLVSNGLEAFLSVLPFTQKFSQGIQEMAQGGPSVLGEGISSTLPATVANPYLPYLQALSTALLLSIFTVFIIKTIQPRKTVYKQYGSIAVASGLLAIVSIGLGNAYDFLPMSAHLDIRYFVLPVIPFAMTAVAIVFALIMNTMNSRRKGTLLLIIMLFAVSTVSSPVFLGESDLRSQRVIPTLSERAAVQFTSVAMTSSPAQVVTDWPFYPYVQAVLTLQCAQTGCNIPPNVANLMYNRMYNSRDITLLLREYFFQSVTLQNVSPYVAELKDQKRWSSFDRIYDSSSVAVLSGTP